jgi:hypothetical protein
MTDTVALSVRQFTEAWKILCARFPGHARHEEDGVACIFSGSPIAFFNVAFVMGRDVTAGALADRARRAADWAGARGVPWMLVVTQEALAPGVDAPAALDGGGLAPVMTLTGMLADEVAPLATVPAGLELEVPRDDAGCAAVVAVNAAAYGMDLAEGGEVLGHAAFWSDKFPVVGRVGGRAVSCSATFVVDGHRYVAWVATEPGEQRKGYADAAMRRSLEVAAAVHGELPSVLHATDAGKPVYERMGYRTIAIHPVFMDKQFL